MKNIFAQNKILNHPEKIDNWIKKQEETIITVELDLTNFCNNKCPKCAGWNVELTKDELSLDVVKKVINDIIDIGAKAIIFTGGGEPTIHKNFLEILQYTSSKKFLEIGLISNGLLLTDKIAEECVKYCTWIRVSLDAGSPDIYKKNHGLNNLFFEKVCSNIQNLIFLKKNMNSNCTIGVGYLTGDDSDINDMKKFCHIMNSYKVDYAQFRPFHYSSKDLSNIIKELEKDFECVTASWQKYSNMCENVKRSYDKCYGVNFTTTICADGNVYICCHMRGIQKYIIGNIKNNSLRDIWKNRKNIFNKIDFKDCPPLCRCDEFNKVLFEINKPKNHINFL